MKKWIFLFSVAYFLMLPGRSQTFSRFIGQVKSLPEEQRQEAVDKFLQTGYAFPFTENDSTVHFIYRGQAESVTLAGDATNWQPTIPFGNIPGTDLWFLTLTYEPDARLDYKIVVNDTVWILDPLNHDTCMSGFGPNSTFHMPEYVRPPELSYYSDIPHGTLTDTIIFSSFLGNSRKIRIYTPAEYDTGNREYPVIVFHDGLEYLDLACAKNILDYLIAHRMIAPVIGVFVPPVSREEEYVGKLKDDFRRFIVGELVPFIRMKYQTRRDAQGWAMTGISNGGFISLYIAIKHPDTFGKTAAQSGNFDPELFAAYQGCTGSCPEIYLDMGTYDIPILEELVSRFTAILRSEGYSFNFYKFPEGHSWCNWAGHLRLPLMQFFPYSGF